jgi:hypothetical protein
MDEAQLHTSDDPRRRTRTIVSWIVVALLAVIVGVVAVLSPRRQGTPEDSRDAAPQADSTETRRSAGPRSRDESTEIRRSAGLRPRGDSQETPSAQEEQDSAARIADGSTAVTVHVVTEDGHACREGTVAFKCPGLKLLRRGTAPLELPRDAPLADGNPVVLVDLPDDMDDLDVVATALVPGMAAATAQFTVSAQQVTSVRIVVPKGRSAEVRVIESETDVPIAGASVVSLTEAERRRVQPRELGGTSGLGAAVADLDGKCVVGGLGPGEHEFVVDAPGHRRAEVKWSQGVLKVRLDRVAGTGSVNVTVIAPDGNPAADTVVEEMNGDRRETTGPDGRARFDDVPAGLAFFCLDLESFSSADSLRRWREKMESGLALMAQVDVAPGGSHEVELGMRRPAASFEGRLVTEDGSPISGMSVMLMADLAIHRATTDEAGFVRLPEVAPSNLIALVSPTDDISWVFDAVEVKQGERATVTWTLGSITVRGRVIRGVDRAPVAGAKVFASGPLAGGTTTDDKGEFTFARARAGIYRVTVNAKSSPGYRAYPVEVTIPAETATVIELVQCGEIVVRFLTGDRASLRDAKIVLTSATIHAPDLRPPESGDGDLVARKVLPGRYDVVVELGGRRRAFPAEVKGGETTLVEVGAP